MKLGQSANKTRVKIKMRPERLAYLRRMQYLYINGLSLLILAGIFFLINSVSVGVSLVVLGVFVLALSFIPLDGKVVPIIGELTMYMEEMDSRQKKRDRIANTMLSIVSGVFLVAGISLLVKGVFLHISVSLSTFAVIGREFSALYLRQNDLERQIRKNVRF